MLEGRTETNSERSTQKTLYTPFADLLVFALEALLTPKEDETDTQE